jgi:hypothetical protein
MLYDEALILEEIREHLKRIDLSGLPYNLEMEAYPISEMDERSLSEWHKLVLKPTHFLRFWATIPDRITLETKRFPFNWLFIYNKQSVAQIVREGLRFVFFHEIDEMILYMNQRLFDPHANGSVITVMPPLQ